MKSNTITQLLKKGIAPTDPRFMREAQRLERGAGETRSLQIKDRLCTGERTLHLSTPMEISRWLETDGRAIRLGPLVEIEVWQRPDGRFLAVQKSGRTWEGYRLKAERIEIVSRVF